MNEQVAKKQKQEPAIERLKRETKERAIHLNKIPMTIVGLKFRLNKNKDKDDEEDEEEDDEEEEEDEDGNYDDDLTYEEMRDKQKILYLGLDWGEKRDQFFRNMMNSEYRFSKHSSKKLDRLQQQLHWNAAHRAEVEQTKARLGEKTDDDDDNNRSFEILDRLSMRLMSVYLLAEVEEIKKMLSKAKRHIKKPPASGPSTTVEACLDTVHALTNACAFFEDWVTDCADIELQMEVVKNLSLLWKSLSKCSNDQLGIDAEQRTLYNVVIKQFNTEGFYLTYEVEVGDKEKFQIKCKF